VVGAGHARPMGGQSSKSTALTAGVPMATKSVAMCGRRIVREVEARKVYVIQLNALDKAKAYSHLGSMATIGVYTGHFSKAPTCLKAAT
jgi:hypothetical protein